MWLGDPKFITCDWKSFHIFSHSFYSFLNMETSQWTAGPLEKYINLQSILSFIEFRMFKFDMLDKRTLTPILFLTEFHTTLMLSLNLIGHPTAPFLNTIFPLQFRNGLQRAIILHIFLAQDKITSNYSIFYSSSSFKIEWFVICFFIS